MARRLPVGCWHFLLSAQAGACVLDMTGITLALVLWALMVLLDKTMFPRSFASLMTPNLPASLRICLALSQREPEVGEDLMRHNGPTRYIFQCPKDPARDLILKGGYQMLRNTQHCVQDHNALKPPTQSFPNGTEFIFRKPEQLLLEGLLWRAMSHNYLAGLTTLLWKMFPQLQHNNDNI